MLGAFLTDMLGLVAKMQDYYSFINIITLMSLAVMALFVFENDRLERRDKRNFSLTFLAIALAMCAEWGGIFLNRGPDWSIGLHKIVKCLDYTLTPAAAPFLLYVVLKDRRFKKFLYILMLANTALQVASIFTGWTFYVDEANIYHHGPAYILYALIYVVAIVSVLYGFYTYGKQYSTRNRTSLFAILIVMVAGIVIQEVFDVRVSYMILTICTVFLFIHYSDFSQLASDELLQYQRKLLEKDPLTGIYSRYAYTDDLKERKSAKENAGDLVVFSIDVNQLKHFNDTLGHAAGDELIKGAADCIQSVLGSYGKCYRTGGDEFIVFLSIEKDRAFDLSMQLEKTADAWRGSLADDLAIAIGYAAAKDHPGLAIEELIRLADEKMYESKAQFYLKDEQGHRKSGTISHKTEDLLPAIQKEYMDIISALSNDITGLYTIDRTKKEVTAYRLSASDHRIRSGVPLEMGFETAMARFIRKNVHPDDREKMQESIKLDYIEEELSRNPSFGVHFRSLIKGETHFHFMKCMRNVADSDYDKIIISFSPEDEAIQMQQLVESFREIENDELTRVYTKQAFLYHAKSLIDAWPDDSFSIAVSDVQNFKIYNNIYGEKQGNELLKRIAQYLLENRGSGLCARYGEDQFVLLVRNLQRERMEKFINEMQTFVNSHFPEGIVINYGIYENVDRSLNVARMCDRAFLALKSIKRNYEQSYAFFDGPVSQQQYKAQMYESRFKHALTHHEFEVWYQPKYNPYTEKIIGAEALVRWRTESGKCVSPGEFLPVFEKDGLIRQLDEYVFRSVCEHQKKWKMTGQQMIPTSVNLSRSSMHQLDIVQRYKAIAEERGITPALIPIELTESAAIDTLKIKPLAEAFYEEGFSLHMDDFGSGESSLTGLNVLHFDVVKLDKSLIDYIGDPQGNLVLMYTIALGRELGLHIVAEGVESREQVEYLKDYGCEAVQGYYYSKPLPEREFEELVRENLDNSSDTYDYIYKLTVTDSIMKRAMDRMLQHMPGGFFIYKADEEERIISSNPYMWRLFGCETEAEFMDYVGGTFKGVVCPEDLERIETYIEKQIAGSERDMDYVKYDIIRKDGKRIPVVDYGHLDRQPDGSLFYVFISENER